MQILDHGYLQFIETWGSDERIVEAARMSTGKGFLGWGADEACMTCNGSGKENTHVTIWDELPTQIPIGPGRMKLEGGVSH